LLPETKKERKKLFPELHRFYLKNSSIALDLSKLSIFRLGEHLMLIIDRGINIAMTGNENELEWLRKKDDKIDQGYAEIVQFLQQIQAENLTTGESKRLEGQIEAVNILESTADIITTDMVEAAEHRIRNGFRPSNVTVEKLNSLYQIAAETFQVALKNFNNNLSVPAEFPVSKEEFKEKLIQTRLYLNQRLSGNDETRIIIFRFESDLLEAIRRLHAFARRLNRKAG